MLSHRGKLNQEAVAEYNQSTQDLIEIVLGRDNLRRGRVVGKLVEFVPLCNNFDYIADNYFAGKGFVDVYAVDRHLRIEGFVDQVVAIQLAVEGIVELGCPVAPEEAKLDVVAPD